MKTGGWRNSRLAVYCGQTLGKNTSSDSAGVIGDSRLSHRPLATDVEPIYTTFTVNVLADGQRPAKLTTSLLIPLFRYVSAQRFDHLLRELTVAGIPKEEVILSSLLSGSKCSNDRVVKNLNGLNYDGCDRDLCRGLGESLECQQLACNTAAVMFGEDEVGRMVLEQIKNSQVTMEEGNNVKHLFFFWSAGPSTGASTELAAQLSQEEYLISGCCCLNLALLKHQPFLMYRFKL